MMIDPKEALDQIWGKGPKCRICKRYASFKRHPLMHTGYGSSVTHLYCWIQLHCKSDVDMPYIKFMVENYGNEVAQKILLLQEETRKEKC
jgi:hypothetical protein